MGFKLNQNGWTLVELMVAAFIGMLLLLIVLRVFLTSKQIYQLHEALTSMQEHGRLAQHLLTTNLRMAGYVGCANSNAIEIYNHVDATQITPIVGYHIDTDTRMLPEEIRGKVVAGTDVLIIQRADEDGASLLSMTTASLTVTSPPSFAAGHILLVSDCNQGDIIQINKASYDSKIKLQLLFSKQMLNKYYNKHALVSKYLFMAFYIGDTGRKNAAGNPIYALYCKDFFASKHIPTEMVEGVQNLSIEYGIFTKKTKTIKYYKPYAVPDWTQVVNVKLLLLLTSIEPTLIRPAQYQFAGKNYQSKDLRLYRQWYGYVTLRQRT
ncbi:N/A [soil metagenome]